MGEWECNWPECVGINCGPCQCPDPSSVSAPGSHPMICPLGSVNHDFRTPTVFLYCKIYRKIILRIPNGKRIWFLYETAPAAQTDVDASCLRIRQQYKNSAYSQQRGPISHIVWTDIFLIFISIMVLNFKN